MANGRGETDGRSVNRNVNGESTPECGILKDKAAVECQRRICERMRNEYENVSSGGATNEDDNGGRIGTLAARQDYIDFEYDDGDGLTLKQCRNCYRKGAEFYVNPDYVEKFLDSVTWLAAEYRKQFELTDGQAC